MLLGGCTATGMGQRPGLSPARCLPKPDVSRDRLIRQLVGLRPWRPSGFVVRAEAFGDKRLVHNYGHGGSGITLSWGTSRLAIDLGLPGYQGSVAVLGAGVIGLTTARLVQQAGFPVTLYAKALPPDTTSNIAGGQWFPSLLYKRSQLTPQFAAQLKQAAAYAYQRYQIMIGEEYGIRWMTNYSLSDQPSDPSRKDELLASMLPESRPVPRSEHDFGYAYVEQFDGMLIEPPRFLRAMLRDIRLAGGEVVVRDFATPADVSALSEGLVFNCTGLGARDLFGDSELQPMRGQLAVLLPQPEVRYALETSGGAYMFSRSDGLLLGGTADIGDDSLTPDPGTTSALIREHQRIAVRMRC
ncbi:FAD-dependent oxidoreductase [Stakelama sediminis]